MNLTERFLADLPPDAALGPELISQACQALRRNRERSSHHLNTEQAAMLIAETARRWLREDDPFRRLALVQGPEKTGFSIATLQRGLDSFFREWTEEKIQALLLQDLGLAGRLDHFCATDAEQRSRQASLALAPELLVHVTAGNLPVPAMNSMLLGILIGSAQFVKCASGASFLPRLLAHSLADTDPALAATLEIAEWPGGTRALEDALFAEANVLTVTGTDETLADIEARLSRRTRFLGFGHRVSFGYVTREALTGFTRRETIEHATDDVVAWDQAGCLSPHLFYVESGGGMAVEQFAESLAHSLEQREQIQPRGAVDLHEAATISSKRDFYKVRAAAGLETQIWQSQDSTAWTVVFESESQFQLSCLNRFVYVKPVADLEDALRGADPVRGKVSTVGLAGSGPRGPELAEALARWGVTRICPLGRMQQPPLTWRHDGRPPLADLIAWANWET